MPSAVNAVAVVDQGLVSAYGDGVACCADGLLSGRPALTRAGDSFSPALREMPVGRVPGLEGGTGRLTRLLERLFATRPRLPADACVYVSTTVGEIDILESDVRAGLTLERPEHLVSSLAGRVAEMLGLPAKTSVLFSAACASSTAALAMAESAIRRGERDCVCVVGCDIVSEFTVSGFSALMALDARGARPFDADRKGVSLGEAAAYAVLMSAERALKEKYDILGYLQGWGMTCDANHLTGPSRDGVPLADAAGQALTMAAVTADDVCAICAHGTGTPYNDQMEMLAFQRAMRQGKAPLFSVKGGMGHTLGAAGLAEMLLSLEFLKRARAPGTVGMTSAAPEAEGWVSTEAQPLTKDGVMLTTNSGFGGVNVALVVGLTAFRASGTRIVTQGPKDARTEEGVITRDTLPAFVPPKHFARFSAEAQRASLALAERLHSEGLYLDPDRLLRWSVAGEPEARIGLVVWNREGSAKVNRAYFADYVASGCVLGRGQLFAATLPTSIASEVAIAWHLTGPLLYVADGEGTACAARDVAARCIREGLAEAMVLLDTGHQEVCIEFMKEGGV